MRHLWILISVFIAIGISLLFRKACGKGEKTDKSAKQEQDVRPRTIHYMIKPSD